MAESILFGLAQSLLQNLGSRALNEIASTWGFKSRLNKLEDTVNSIKNVLLDAEERQVGRPDSHAVQGWLDRLKTVVYDADDLFDEFATVASQRQVSHTFPKSVTVFFSTSNQIKFAINISMKFKKIRADLDYIVKDGSAFSFVVRPREEGGLSSHVRDQTHSYVDAIDVIGRDDDKKAIIDIMLASNSAREKPLSVICIVGIGGMGKTTLAQHIFNDEMVEKHFELKLWVCVSEAFDQKEVIKKILMSATCTESQNLEMEQLQRQLREKIGGKKYLLVLDDVWNEDPLKWLSLSQILKVGGKGSKILVSTRSRVVADIMGAVPAHGYYLEGLSEEKSWALFEKMAFEPGESLKKPELVKLGKEVVKKCACVPLAIITLGTLLFGKDEHKWNSILSTGFTELADYQNNVMAILKLSYNHLFSPLKKCFAYCALFPKDYVFKKETLVDLWMAEGFIIPAIETQSLNELGDEYIMLLLQRCFFQDITRDKWGNISGFKMHDLMHDLALQIAGTESKVAKPQDVKFSDRIRHVSFDYQLTNMQDIPSCLLKAKQLRTFLLLEQYYRDDADFNKTSLKQLFSNLRCLRVLDLQNLGIRSLPKSIGKLIHLRYLNLSENPIKKLPPSITRLQNLQTLILYQCKKLRALPKSIGKLIHLRYLNLSWNPIKKLPPSITRLQNLQTLILDNCFKLRALPIHTRKLTNLRNLDIDYCESLTYMPAGLGELTSLHKLPSFMVKCQPATANLRDLKTLNNLRGYLWIRLGHLEDPVSEVLSSKHGLTELSLSFKTDSCEHASGSNHDEALLEGLKPHPNLKQLGIHCYRGQQFASWAMEESLCMTLPNLVQIGLYHCGQCRKVPSFSQLPCLRRLSLINLQSVEYLEKSPTETFFPSLQELTLVNMDSLKGWWEETEAIDHGEQDEVLHQSSQRHHQPLSFSVLSKLQIEDCTSLASFPLIPNVEELSLKNVRRNLTVLTKLTSSVVSGNGESSVTSSKLLSLSVDEVEDLISMPEETLGQITSVKIEESKLLNTSTLEEVFKRLSSLSRLRFTDCKSLKSVYEGMEHLTSLESLTIWGCEEVDLSQNEQLEEGMPWKAFNNLRSLSLYDMPKLVHLSSGIQHLTKLRSLWLSGNVNLVELPKWISCLSSLESMSLHECPKLKCLPEEFGKLTTLNSLDIRGCPGLKERCRGPTGSDWPKIQHIVDRDIYE